MRLIARVTEYLLDWDALYRIRSDWVELYHEAYNSEEFQNRFNFHKLREDELETRAIKSMERAKNFRPHGSITGTIEKVSRIFNLLRLALLILATFLSGTIFGLIHIIFAITTQIQSLVISSVPLDFWVIGTVYLYAMQTDDKFVQEFNSNIGFAVGEIVSSRRDGQEKLFGQYLWNNGLCDRRKVPVLLILYLIFQISESIYQRIMNAPRGDLERFIDVQNYRDSFQTALKIELSEE